MKRKVIFLDRDGTINVEKNYLYKIDDFEFLPGVIEALQRFKKQGYDLIIITNQSGIARGYYSEQNYTELMKYMNDRLHENGIDITAIYYCPHHPEGDVLKYRVDCDCRKPKLALFEKAIKQFDIDIKNSYAIGDKLRDLAVCMKYDCKGYLVNDTEDADVIEQVKDGRYKNIRYCKNILECNVK